MRISSIETESDYSWRIVAVAVFLDGIDISSQTARVDTETGEAWLYVKGPDGELARFESGDYVLERRVGKLRLAWADEEDSEGWSKNIRMFLQDGIGEEVTIVEG
jgi:hypothetical protein